MRRDIEFNAEDLTLRGWFYVPDGGKKIKYFLAALLLVPSLAMSDTAQARTKETSALPRANEIVGREVAAPPWSSAGGALVVMTTSTAHAGEYCSGMVSCDFDKPEQCQAWDSGRSVMCERDTFYDSANRAYAYQPKRTQPRRGLRPVPRRG